MKIGANSIALATKIMCLAGVTHLQTNAIMRSISFWKLNIRE